MFFFIPIGHDRTPPGFPAATFLLILVNLVAFLVSHGAERDAMERSSEAVFRAAELQREQPRHACVYDDVYSEVPSALRRMGVFEPCGWFDDPHPAVAERMTTFALEATRAFAGRPLSRWGFTPSDPSPLTLITSMFLHGGLAHIFGNMIFLFLAGPVVEAYWGRIRYVAFYLVAGAAATGAHFLSDPTSTIPLVGASGAIAGVLGAFLVAYPKARIRFLAGVWVFVRVFTKVVPLPAWVVLPGWAALQLYNATAITGAPVAYWAHVGGFVVGGLAGLMARKLGWGTAGPTLAEVERKRQPALRKRRGGARGEARGGPAHGEQRASRRGRPAIVHEPARRAPAESTASRAVAPAPRRVATAPRQRVPSNLAPRLVEGRPPGAPSAPHPRAVSGAPLAAIAHPWAAARVELNEGGLRCTLPDRNVALRWEELSVIVVRGVRRADGKIALFADLVGAPVGDGYPPPVRITTRTAVNYAVLPGGSAHGIDNRVRALLHYAAQRRPGLHLDGPTLQFLEGELATTLTPAQVEAYEARYSHGS